jgi:hypothetical protein
MNTQQNYLLRAATELVKVHNLKLDPAGIIYSYGFPKARGRHKVIGQCLYQPKPTGYGGAIFVHPCQWKTPLDVLHVLLHELIHAETPGAGHKGEFSAICKRVGLVKPWTSTTPGEELKTRLNKIAETLGEFPQADFDLLSLKRPGGGSRLRLWMCECGVKVRVASDDFQATCQQCEGLFEMQAPKKVGI